MDELTVDAVLADLMSAPVNAIADALERLAEVMQQVAETVSEGMTQSAGATEALQASMDELAGSVDTLAASVDANSASVDANTDSLDANTEALDANSEAEDTNNAATGEGASSAKKLVGPLAIATAAVVGLGAVSLVAAGNFQQSMAQLVTGAGESQSNLQMVTAGVLQMATQVGESTGQLASGLYMIESGGYHGAAGLAILKAAAEGAKVGNADLGVVADATDTTLKNFGQTGLTATQAVNALIATVSHGKTTLQDLSGALAQVLPTASAAHVGLNSVMGAMATMTGEGVPAANAATYLRQTILALDAPSSAAEKALASVGLTTQQVSTEMQKSLPNALAMITDAVGKKFPPGSAAYVNALKNISGGSKTMQGMLDLTGDHLAMFQSNVASVGDAVTKGGNQINGWALTQQNFNQQMAQAGAQLEVVGIKIGQALMPIAEALVAHVMPSLEQFGNWAASHGAQLAQIFEAVAGALGAGLVAALWAAAGAFIAVNGVLILIVGTVMAVAAGVILLYERWAPFRDAVNGVANALAHWRDGLQDAVAWIQEFQTPLEVAGGILLGIFLPALIQTGATMVVTLVPSLIASAGAFITMATTAIVSAVSGLVAYAAAGWAAAAATIAATWPILLIIAAIALLAVGIYELISHWSQVSAWLTGVWNIVVHAVGAAFSWLGTQAHDAVMAVGNWFSWLGTQIHDRIQLALNTLQTLWAMVPLLIQLGLKQAEQIVVDAFNTVVGWFEWLYNHNYYFADLVNFIRDEFTLGQKLIETIWTTITSWLRNAWTAISSLATTVWRDMVSAVQSEWRLIQTTIQTVWGAVSGWLTTQWNNLKNLASAAWSFVAGIAQRDWALVQRYIITPLETVWAKVQSVANQVKSFLQSAWSTVVSDVTSAWSRFVGAITSAGGQAVATVHDHIVSPITSAIQGIITTAMSWGSKLVQMFIQGLKNEAGALASEAKNLAQNVASFLGFHSPAEQGPGADADQWMPNLGKMLASGLSAQTTVVGAAATHVAGALAGPFSAVPNGPLGASAAALSGAGAGAAMPSAIHVHLHDETGAGGLTTGLKMLDPTVRRNLAQEIAQEWFTQASNQGRQPISPATGSK